MIQVDLLHTASLSASGAGLKSGADTEKRQRQIGCCTDPDLPADLRKKVLSDTAPDSLPDLLPLLSTHPETVQGCIDRYGGLVWSLARRHSPTAADAEDAVQDIFLALWKNAARFDASKASEAAFITMIARRRLIDLGRKRQRRPQTTGLDPNWDFPGSGAKQLEASAEARRAAEEIARLEPKERNVVLLSTCQGFSHSQIADRTGLPLGTVKTYARRGLQRVRDALNAPRKPPGEVSK